MSNGQKFRARAAEWDLGVAGTGTEQIGVTFALTDHPGERRTWYGAFTEKALPRTVESLRHMGWKGIDPTELAANGGGLDTNEVEIVIEAEEYPEGSGKYRDKVRWVNSLGGLGMKDRLQDDKLKAFGARMKKAIASLDPAAAKKSAQAPKPNGKALPPASSEPGDEIPF